MQHKLINTENYLLVVDDSEIKAGDLVIENQELNQIFQVQDINKVNGLCRSKVDTYVIDSCKKITAHLPLNNSPILEGVDLLPPLEDEVEKLAEEWNDKGEFTSPYSFKAGYNKFKEKYKYTEEDILDAWELGASEGLPLTREKKNNLIKHLQQPKMPVGFKCEINNPMFALSLQPQITTNSQGLTQWVGEYIY